MRAHAHTPKHTESAVRGHCRLGKRRDHRALVLEGMEAGWLQLRGAGSGGTPRALSLGPLGMIELLVATTRYPLIRRYSEYPLCESRHREHNSSQVRWWTARTGSPLNTTLASTKQNWKLPTKRRWRGRKRREKKHRHAVSCLFEPPPPLRTS